MDDSQREQLQDILAELEQMSKKVVKMLGEDKVKPPKPRKPKVAKIQYAEYVSMTETEYKDLIDRFGVRGTEDRIVNLNLYKGSTGKKYNSDHLTILAWERRNPGPKAPDKARQERMI